MNKLTKLDGTELTEYTVQLLLDGNITTVREFLSANVDDINRIARLPETAISQIKSALLKAYGPTAFKLHEQYKNSRKFSTTAIYGTGIASLDDLLADDGFAGGSVWELCGIAGIGKTQTCHTIALNFAQKCDNSVLYIDTKLDFSATRLMQMMQSRQLSSAACGQLMQQILVERPMSFDGLVHVLRQLLQRLQKKDPIAANIKLIIIDAITAVWFLQRVQRHKGYCGLTQLSQLVWRLARQHQVAFVLTNLSIPHAAQTEYTNASSVIRYTQGDSDDDYDSDEGLLKPKSVADSLDECDTHQVLGRLWNSVPHVRLSLEQPNGEVEIDEGGATATPTGRTVRIVKSCYTRSGATCHINITAQGVR